MGTTKPDLCTTAAGIADWLNGVKNRDDDQSLMKDGFKRIAKRALQAEMLQPLGDDKPAAVGKNIFCKALIAYEDR